MMEQTETQTRGRQGRLAAELEERTARQPQRPQKWRAPETLPNPDERPGWSHRWIRISTLGTADPSNISGKFREGYEACKAEEYPELMLHATTEGRFKGNIEVGGLLLCRIPKEFMGQRAEFYEAQNKAQMESVDNNFLREKDGRSNMALFADKKTSVSFGSGS
jgi:hypothetical protein